LSRPRTLKLLAFNATLLAILLCVIEGAATLFVSMPSRFLPSGRPLDLARSMYWGSVTEIGYDPACGQYDEHLAYTLRPGACTFSSREFFTRLEINSLGLRDDERSLHGPRIIVLGDSHAMGWGVDQDRTFAQIIEARTGVPVLNAAIASYGTAREILNLRRLETDHLGLLVIQYCDNDFEENEAFSKDGNTLPIMSRSEYLAVAERQRRASAYFFGKNTLRLVQHTMRDLSWHPAAGARTRAAPELFLNVITHGPVDLHGVVVLVLETNTGYEGNDEFIPLLDEVLASEPARAGGLTITTLDLRPVLTPDDYFRLDGHLNARGHRAIADAILQRLPTLLR
jgi:hypothetical protein